MIRSNYHKSVKSTDFPGDCVMYKMLEQHNPSCCRDVDKGIVVCVVWIRRSPMTSPHKCLAVTPGHCKLSGRVACNHQNSLGFRTCPIGKLHNCELIYLYLWIYRYGSGLKGGKYNYCKPTWCVGSLLHLLDERSTQKI